MGKGEDKCPHMIGGDEERGIKGRINGGDFPWEKWTDEMERVFGSTLEGWASTLAHVTWYQGHVTCTIQRPMSCVPKTMPFYSREDMEDLMGG